MYIGLMNHEFTSVGAQLVTRFAVSPHGGVNQIDSARDGAVAVPPAEEAHFLAGVGFVLHERERNALSKSGGICKPGYLRE